uniref:Uncharacterized protein n=1 Tax=Arundo donax TaxID=35708 RepID=A0A0A9EG21_ARUDO
MVILTMAISRRPQWGRSGGVEEGKGVRVARREHCGEPTTGAREVHQRQWPWVP